ncbi:FAD-binding oxidoreductase [Arenibaculum pallidiluteum]|uniref:FAD-binding oxidoreductase n=1 Tax=Arenibaculum pallidiluteum TaxID=2812559 RepID=UPI001A95C8B7|nr:FAD-binding oxidoreductase [Arenibaculum pallidiluteum]
MRLSGWGNYPRAECRTVEVRGAEEIAAGLAGHASAIARGNGRAYGDAALNPEATLLTRRHDRILAFDGETGRITCESGILLSDLLEILVPRGWFPPVTPGTRLVSVGGMIASDVHGKNHHVAGSFCRHVEGLELMQADGRVLTCSPTENADLFLATCGGMGLTGVIVTATFRLLPIASAWIRQETLRCANLAEVMAAFEASQGWTYSVAWIDCLAGGTARGRSLLHRGEHAWPDELDPGRGATPLILPPRPRRRVPATFPDFALTSLSVRAFNEIYYRAGRPGTQIVDYDRFFYPLDAVLDWNRIYGRRGFIQYQCVLPKAAGSAGLEALLDAIARSGLGSFLAVLKLFGPGDAGLLSFPMEGYTLALDFPIRTHTLALADRLDAIVAEQGGRIYLAKDARMPPAMLRQGYPQLDRFLTIRRASGAERFSSLLSRRLEL